jgi:hypothetical protein
MHFLCQPFAFVSPCHAAINKGQNPTNSGQASKTPSTSQAFGKSHDWHEFCLYKLTPASGRLNGIWIKAKESIFNQRVSG